MALQAQRFLEISAAFFLPVFPGTKRHPAVLSVEDAKISYPPTFALRRNGARQRSLKAESLYHYSVRPSENRVVSGDCLVCSTGRRA